MNVKGDSQRYGIIAISLHWGLALGIFVVLGLGVWMADMDYYDPWYLRAPWWHKSMGFSLVSLMCLRLVWHLFDRRPELEATLKNYEKILAIGAHRLLYLLIFMIGISGYLISTAEGVALSVFDWFMHSGSHLKFFIDTRIATSTVQGRTFQWTGRSLG